MQTNLILWVISVLSIASSTVVQMTNETHDLIQFARDIAIINRIDPEKFVKLINCESKFKINALGDFSLEKKKYLATGILQFHEPTFVKYSKIYDFGGEYKDPKDQMILASWMIRDGLWRAWYNCGKINGYGAS